MLYSRACWDLFLWLPRTGHLCSRMVDLSNCECFVDAGLGYAESNLWGYYYHDTWRDDAQPQGLSNRQFRLTTRNDFTVKQIMARTWL